MPRASAATASLPPAATSALAQLGRDLATARLRRRESQRVWAERVGVSVPTLIRMERGDPRVAMGVYATALWMVGRTAALAGLADPSQDRGALELEIRNARAARAHRSSSAPATGR